MTAAIHVVHAPFALPSPPEVPFAMLDVAFAGADRTPHTHAFIAAAGARLRLWVDHHEHPDWDRYAGDARFVLIPGRNAHACPELVTPAVVARAGEVGALLAHHDLDGLLSAMRFLLGGREPWPGADEDARAADSPGRGHVMSPRARRLSDALGEAGAALDRPGFDAFYREIAGALLAGEEPAGLSARVDSLAAAAADKRRKALQLALTRRVEAPGVCVLRIGAQLDRRMRSAVLDILEAEADVGLVLEGTPKRYWATAATWCDAIPLENVPDLDRGRHDFRFGPTRDADALVRRLSALAAAARK